MKIGGLLKNIVGTVAPKLANTLGGPLAGMAVGAIADALGVEPTEKAVAQRLQNPTPDDLLRLKNAENEFAVRIKELELDESKLAVQDVQDARKAFSGDWTPKAFALGILIGFFAFIFFIVSDDWNKELEPLLNIILGGLLANVASVASFYFGSSQKGNSS